jgi:hypothetical protein
METLSEKDEKNTPQSAETVPDTNGTNRILDSLCQQGLPQLSAGFCHQGE